MILLPIVLSAHSQSWCAPGATWTYNAPQIFGGPGPTPEYLLRVEYVGDTVIEGLFIQRLDQWYLTYISGDLATQEYGGPLFTYVEDEVIYLKQTMADVYDTLFNLNAHPGDHWTVAGMGSSYNVIVIDTSTTLMDGIPLRQLVVDASSLGLTEPDTITARIGFHYLYIQPSASFTPSLDGPVHGLRCYRDNEIEFIRIPGIGCDFSVAVPHLIEFPISRIHPNPGSDQLTLQLPPGKHHLSVIDILGRTVLEKARISDQGVIDASSLRSGIYMLQITDRSGRRSNQQWIKE
ncbi:MAG: T9SS type A sorting domain-containing protein [Bacteroidota bacterium]|nr:T9SS type A sorting domain-containing protein [Bacteroidota bacterium]